MVAFADPPALYGAQRPRICSFPDSAVSSWGVEAVELARMAGLVADPWQEWLALHSMGQRLDGKWSAFEVGVEMPRQNGKNGFVEIRELAGLFLLGERLIIHSAHEFATAEEALERMVEIIDGCPDLSRRVRTIKRSHGQEGIYLTNGQRLRYKTRTKGGGRGFSCDLLVDDEAMEIPEAMHGAMLPTLSARPNPQVIYTGSAVDEAVHQNGVVFARVRERGIKGDPGLMYVEWSACDLKEYERNPQLVATDPEMWARANPGLGIRITGEHISREQRSMAARTFAVERLGIGYWPDTTEEADRKISRALWAATLDAQSRRSGAVALTFDVNLDRASAAIGIAGPRADGKWHGEVVEHHPGTGWVLPRLAELARKLKPVAVLYQAGSPAASLVAEAENLKIRKLESVSTSETAEACGMFFDAIDQGTFKRGPQPELDAAVDGAGEKSSGDAWLWSRKASTADITPLVTVTLALWGAMSRKKKRAGVVDLAAALANAEQEDA